MVGIASILEGTGISVEALANAIYVCVQLALMKFFAPGRFRPAPLGLAFLKVFAVLLPFEFLYAFVIQKPWDWAEGLRWAALTSVLVLLLGTGIKSLLRRREDEPLSHGRLGRWRNGEESLVADVPADLPPSDSTQSLPPQPPLPPKSIPTAGAGTATLSQTAGIPAVSAGPVFLMAIDVPPRSTPSIYPPAFAHRTEGRVKRQLGEQFGLHNFGVNLTTIEPGGTSALRHAHSKQDEFVYILEGTATLVTDAGEFTLPPGSCAGFRAGDGNGHQLINRSGQQLVYLEVGDRSPGDTVTYPDDDLAAAFVDGRWVFTHKDGRPY